MNLTGKIFLALFVSFFSISASAETHEVIIKNKSYKIEDGGSIHFMPVVSCPDFEFVFRDVSVHKIPAHIRKRNNDYILSRMGEEFFENDVVQTQTLIVDRDSTERRRNMGGDHCNMPVKYAFKYEFIMANDVKFQFYTYYDSIGTKLFRNQMPNIKTDPTVYDFLPVEEIIQVALDDKTNKGKEIIDIRPKYEQAYNSYLWVVRKPSVEEVVNGMVTYRVLFIDAVTGEVEMRRERKYFEAVDMPE